jgi:hypothetical protein
MPQSTKKQTNSAVAVPVEKLYIENTLLRVSGALFCHDAKRAPTRTQEIILNSGVNEKSIVIRPDPRLGQPGPLAHKIFVALIKKHSNYGRPIQSEISFSKRELVRLIGRSKWGGSASDQLTRALSEIHHAFVTTNFKVEEKNRLAQHSFAIFPEIYLERTERATDPVETCVVTRARPIVASLQDDHFTCLNHALMQQLGTIGQALYMRLFFHFANLYDGHHKDRLSFPKRYDDLCAEWLGGLTVHKHRSIIVRDQLGPHLRRLAQVGFLASYHIAEAKNGNGFIVLFRPGQAFFADYDRFYRQRVQGELQWSFHADRREITEPLKVAYLFIEKRTGQPVKDIPYVSSRDVTSAKHLLSQLSFEDIPDFLDYALAEANKTHFDMQTLGAVRQYLNGYAKARARRAAAKTTESARQAEERATQARMDYDRFRRAAAEELFASLPEDECSIIEDLARSKASQSAWHKGPLAEIMHGADKARITIERHPGKIPSFEHWAAVHAERQSAPA